MNRTRLAVIGGGIAGLGAAWLLRRRYDVTVFEREGHIGGHSNTVEVDEDGRRVPIDTGFMVFNKVTYPYLLRLFEELQVPIKPTEMSFSVRHEGFDLEYNGMGLNRVLPNGGTWCDRASSSCSPRSCVFPRGQRGLGRQGARVDVAR